MTLTGFEESSFTHAGKTRVVYRRGVGPAVVVMHEIPGIIPEVSRFATRLADAGFSVYLPHLFGEVGPPASPTYVLGTLARICVSHEFKVLAARESSPITDWLRALARHAFAETGGKGVGAIGMCITGNFGLTLAMDDAVIAPVLSQPSLPLPILPGSGRGLAISDTECAHLRERAGRGLQVLGLRFTHDFSSPRARFDRLREELGDAFVAIEIDSSRGNPYGNPTNAHSVLTRHLLDEEGHPTRAALERVIAFFTERLK